MDTSKDDDNRSQGDNSIVSSATSTSWNSYQENLLKGISERSNCMRWLHNQCQLHFENLNFYFTIPNVIISTLNGSFTMSLTSLFSTPEEQKVATTIIGLISIFSAVLITMNQYVKSQQMMEAHRAAGLAYGKLHRIIMNELALRRDQRQNSLEFLKFVRTEQDRLENSSPSILPSVIRKFNKQFEHRDIEKPEIAGDLDETTINTSSKTRRHIEEPAGSGITGMISKVVPLLRQDSPVASIFTGGALRRQGSSGLFTTERERDRERDPPPIRAPRNQIVPSTTSKAKTDESIPENIDVQT